MLIELRIAGTGGQGSVMAGQLFAAAAVKQGLFATQSQFYGSEIQGGPAVADVRISDEPVMFPWVTAPDILVALHQNALDAHLKYLKPDGTLIYDPLFVTRLPEKGGRTVHAVRLAEMADGLGRRVVANVIAVAVVARLSGLLTQDSVRAVVDERIARGKELNQKAVATGYALSIGATA
ncbi:MAG: 2-oxoacid:acceptor oxidoreductase family protein [Betaproteobacteria bacterium]|nr:2-oxoacid:acceptor oxidoreductase family protein [Betaproteobacteria bacterium]